MLDLQNQSAPKEKKVLLRKREDNSFDWWALFIIFLGGVFEVSIFLSVVLTYRVAHSAGLNIGIAQTIWSLEPFFVSMLERFVYKERFNFNQLYGTAAMILCAVLVSLS